MSGENQLKPCFVAKCANHSKSDIAEFFEDGVHYIKCWNCGARGPEGNTAKESITGWNEVPRATPPGTELVPEGTMDAFAELLGCLPGRIVTRDIGTCGKCGGTTASGMHKICYKCLREKASAILTRHRATKETPNAQG